MRAESIVDLGNVSLAIGSQLISDPRPLSASPILLFFAAFTSVARSFSLYLSPPPAVCIYPRRPFPSRSFSLRSPPRLAHVRRDNSYVLRMHNVPNYFTLLLLRVINARRLARARAPVPGVFREIYCSEITRVRTRRRPTLCFSLSLSVFLPLPSSSVRTGVPRCFLFSLLSVISYHSCTRSEVHSTAIARFHRLAFLFPTTRSLRVSKSRVGSPRRIRQRPA